jgi:hypothetical protein
MEVNVKRFLLAGLLLAAMFSNPMQADFFQCPPACIGSDNADIMNGSPVADNIEAGLGNDIIFGGDGRDILLNGQGDDDLIFGGLDTDILDGEAGNDTFVPGPDDANDVQFSNGMTGNDTFIVLVSETVNCQYLHGNEGFDVTHLIGFGPYIAEYPFGAAEPIAIGSAIVLQDPIAGGYIFIPVEDANGSSMDRINGLPTPNATVLDPTTAGQIELQNCTFIT